ncbi:hypothetical protein GFY24_16530 [Nocardia sp. SYP-A9097]|nr:hypothetical protein [Nocardia sp. SYP-A9097]MRH89034.1 hypothetical protein [Nocardia sp. SYP-A9097]
MARLLPALLLGAFLLAAAALANGSAVTSLHCKQELYHLPVPSVYR